MELVNDRGAQVSNKNPGNIDRMAFRIDFIIELYICEEKREIQKIKTEHFFRPGE